MKRKPIASFEVLCYDDLCFLGISDHIIHSSTISNKNQLCQYLMLNGITICMRYQHIKTYKLGG